MSIMEFIRTGMGQTFFNGTIPRIVATLERIADTLEKDSLDRSKVREEPSAVVPTDTWSRDDIQFARLLSEISAMGLSGNQYTVLMSSMGLNEEDIDVLFHRAEKNWDWAKDDQSAAHRKCIACDRRFKKE